MRRTGVAAAVSAGFACLFGVTLWAAHLWFYLPVDSSAGVGDRSSTVLDGSEYPHISYADSTNSDLKYACWDGSQWIIEAADEGGTVAAGADTSLDLDSTGKAHISYYQSGTAFKDLKYARRDGPDTWVSETVASTGDVGRFSSLAVDSSDCPHIAYCDETDGDLEYAVGGSGSWSFETPDSAPDVGVACSLALDSTDRPHIAYLDAANAAVKYAWRNGTGWSFRPSISSASWPDLVLDSSDTPHIAYQDPATKGLGYAVWGGASWTTEPVDTTTNLRPYPEITIGSDGVPQIAYWDMSTTDLKLAVRNGSPWTVEVVDDSGGVWRHVSIVLGSLNDPQISYRRTDLDCLQYAATEGPLAVRWPRWSVQSEIGEVDGSSMPSPKQGLTQEQRH